MANGFPTHTHHNDVRCFGCQRRFGKDARPQLSGYPPKHGEWRQFCKRCMSSTFYDIREERSESECLHKN